MELQAFCFHGTPFLLERMTLLGLFSKILPLKETQRKVFVANTKTQVSSKKKVIENLYLSPWTWRLPNYLKTSDETGGDINRCAFLISPWDEIRQHLKDLHNSMNQYFSNAKCTMSPNHVPLPRMQARRTIDFKVMVDLKLLWLQIALCNSPLRNQACQETEAHRYLKEPVHSSLVHVHI